MSIKVILADDHRIMRDGLRSVLESESGFEIVGEAQNGREAVKLTRQLEPDVVVMDVGMPDLNGVDATSQIADLGLSTKVVALSMHAEGQYVQGMLQAGAAGYILKDCAGDELVQALQAVMSNRSYVSPQITDVIVSDYVARLSGEVTAQAPVLSTREREVLQLISEGQSTASIAERLHVSVKTVETHRKRLMDKLDIRSVAGLTKYAIREGITSVGH
ncbi:MAG: response regulator [Gammaproteobacteria bacterium]